MTLEGEWRNPGAAARRVASMVTQGRPGGSPIIAARLVQYDASWTLPLYVMAALYACSALTWLFVRPPQTASPARP